MRGLSWSLVVLPVALCSAPSRSDTLTWTVPGTVNAAGLNGTRFVSDLALTNPGVAAAVVTISFLPQGGAAPRQITLNGGQTVVYRNVLDGVFGVQGAGATQVASDAPVLVRARTYNTAPSGTYGVALPVFAGDRLLAPGDSADSLWVSQSGDASAGYRTNVAVVFPEESGGEALVTLFDADGNELGAQVFSLDAAGFQQFAVASFAPPVAVARAAMKVARGTAAAYSVVVDNVTGDSSLFTFEPLPQGWQDVLVNGVARANGRNATFFRTDGRFFNPTSEDATVTVAFHDNRSANDAPLTRDFVVPAGKIRDVVDVLDSLLGLPVGSAGALRFRSEAPIAILCRTSNVDPAGLKPGTFGAQQKPRQILSFLMSADAGAVVTGIRQNASFRTNVGFAAGPDGAGYTLTLKDASGATAATSSASLGVFGWTQPNVADLFPGVGIPDDATLLVRVTSGSLDVFDSSIDNSSGDPVVTPTMPVPADIPSTATIGPGGGSVRSADGLLTLRVPAGALAAPTPLSIANVSNDAPGALGSAYDVSPAGLAFAKPALLSLRYGAGDLPVGRIGGVAVAVLTAADWAGLSGGRIDDSERSLLVPLGNTSPPTAAARPGARPLAAGGASRFGAVAALELQSGNKVDGIVWVPTGGKLKITAIFRVQPTSSGQDVLVVPLNKGGGGVTVTWDRPNLGSFDSLSGGAVTYTAPARIPDQFSSVHSVVHALTAPGARYDTRFDFIVLRRNYLFDAYYNLNIPCSGTNTNVSVLLNAPVVTYDYFHFDDDLSVHAGPNVFIGAPATPAVTSCPGKCHDALASGATGNLQLNDLSATFHGVSGFFILGENFQKNALPPYTQQGDPLFCTGSDGVDLLVPVIIAPYNDLFWHLSFRTQTSKNDGGAITLIWEWRSVDGDIPPEGL